jgi:hypothetical protein
MKGLFGSFTELVAVQVRCAVVLAKKMIARHSVSYAAVSYRDAKESAACQMMGSKSKQQ